MRAAVRTRTKLGVGWLGFVNVLLQLSSVRGRYGVTGARTRRGASSSAYKMRSNDCTGKHHFVPFPPTGPRHPTLLEYT